MSFENETLCTHINSFECPFCGKEKSLEVMDVPWEDDSEYEYECSGCGNELTVRAYVSVCWYVGSDEDDNRGN